MNRENDRRIWQDTSRLLQMITEGGSKVSVVTHVNPDGDALGSSLGMAKLLTNLGNQCTVVLPNDFPDFLKWMPGSSDIMVYGNGNKKASRVIGASDLIISLDFNDLERIRQFRSLVEQSNAYKVLIDHHPGPDDFAHCIISDTAVSSTAELIWQFILSAGLRKHVDADVASCLFAGIMTDTGCFSHNASSPSTYEAAAELLSFGIDRDRIHHLVYDNFSSARMRLLGYCLNEKMKVMPELQTAYISLSLEEQQRFQFRAGDSEGFVNLPLSISGIRFTAFFIEKKDHVKISFRSKGNFDVNAFAERYFKGGGHRNASGGESSESMEKTIALFETALLNHKDNLAI